jgi:hypothetical protein
MQRSTQRVARASSPWFEGEDQVRLSDLPRLIPPLPGGRRVSIASCYRWTTAGLHGVRLRRFKAAGSWATTSQELARWQAAQTAMQGC